LQYSYSLRFNISIVLPIQTILFCYFHMYRTLTDPKFFCRLSDRRIAVYNIICNSHCPFFDIFFHGNPPENLFLQCMQGGKTIFGMQAERTALSYFNQKAGMEISIPAASAKQQDQRLLSILYPTPRIVSIQSPASPSFWRRVRICTSTVRLSPSNS